MNQEKEKLLKLEQTGEYVFHGSGELVRIFGPRQAHNFKNEVQEEDGEPAVFASSAADYAIFMAIIHKKNCPQGYYSSAGQSEKDGISYLRLRATEKTLRQLDDAVYGWVYIFRKDQFTPREEGGIEYVCTHRIAPLKRVRVTKRDLSETIELLEE
jgi:hypothetical protein